MPEALTLTAIAALAITAWFCRRTLKQARELNAETTALRRQVARIREHRPASQIMTHTSYTRRTP